MSGQTHLVFSWRFHLGLRLNGLSLKNLLHTNSGLIMCGKAFNWVMKGTAKRFLLPVPDMRRLVWMLCFRLRFCNLASCFFLVSLRSSPFENAPSSIGFDSRNPVFSAFVKSSSPFSVRIIVNVQPSSPSPPTETSASSELKSSHTLQLVLTYCFMSASGMAVVPAGVVTKHFSFNVHFCNVV